MAKRITKDILVPSALAPKAKFKELVEVKYDDGWFRGWKTDAKWASILGVSDVNKNPEAKVVILFEDGSHTFGTDKSGMVPRRG